MPNANEMDARPTKEFFIDVVVRDIELEDAILDLVDNSIDGARRIHPTSDDMAGRNIAVKFDADSFSIKDNCGGIPLEVAKKYAFRFGREPGWTPKGRTIGQFGVGMKRALFKLGRGFTVESRTATDGFKVVVDVDAWKADTAGPWVFPFTRLKAVPQSRAGTTISVQPLHASITERVQGKRFTDALIEQIGRLHSESLARGLVIKVNGISVPHSAAVVLVGKGLAPRREHWVEKVGTGQVRVDMFAGIEKAEGAGDRNAGWYVYCNGRLVLGPDTTDRTGWGIGSVPRFHPQYSQFRGHLFMDAEQSWLLPWNTTKTGVDLDSDVYRRIRDRMMIATREVIALFNQRKAEGQVDKRPLTDAIKAATGVPLAKVKASKQVKYPVAPDQLRYKNILYRKPAALADQVRDEMGAPSYAEAGSRSFDYWVEHELED